MSDIIDMPVGLQLTTQNWGQKRFDLAGAGGDTGSTQVRIWAPPRWTCGLASAERLGPARAAAWRALVARLEGRVNYLAVRQVAMPLPRGTLRGLPVMPATVAAGASFLDLQTDKANAGRTLLEGDWIGVNQADLDRQMLMVTRDATVDANGAAVVHFKPALRVQVNAGGVVVLDRPTCLMRQTSDQTSWTNSLAQKQGGFTLDLMESWE